MTSKISSKQLGKLKMVLSSKSVPQLLAACCHGRVGGVVAYTFVPGFLGTAAIIEMENGKGRKDSRR